jgi:hypothetical protein
MSTRRILQGTGALEEELRAVSPRERGNVNDSRLAEKAKEAQKDVDLGAPYDRDTHFCATTNDCSIYELFFLLT